MITSSEFYGYLNTLNISRQQGIAHLRNKGIDISSDASIPNVINRIPSLPNSVTIQNLKVNGSAVIVTAELENVSITLQDETEAEIETKTTDAENGGIVYFNVSDTANKTYTLVAKDGSGTELWRNTITVDGTGIYNCKCGKLMNDYEWPQIKKAFNSGYGRYMFNLWDFKKLTSFMGQTSDTYTKVYYIGAGQDTNASGNKNTVTLFIERTSSSYKHWNTSATNDNGISWVGSLIRQNCLRAGEDYYTWDKNVTGSTSGTYYVYNTETNTFDEKTLPADYVASTKYYTKSTMYEDGAFWAGLPDDFKELLVQVVKKTWGGYGGAVTSSTLARDDNTIIETKDWLFLPSSSEIFGTEDRYTSTVYDKRELEGEQYQAFKEFHENRYRLGNDRWFRNPYVSGSYYFCYWYSGGYVYSSGANSTIYVGLCCCM